jgi:hypothetical protein
LRISVPRHARRHSLRPVEDPARARHAFAGEEGGEKPVRGGFRGVQLLRVGGVAEEFPEAGGLRSGGAERLSRPLRVEPEELRSRRRGGEGARGAGGVEDGVVGAPEKFADADSRLVAGDRGEEKILAGALLGLRQGEDRGEDDRSRMEDGPVVHVVLLHYMGRRPVDQGGEVRARSGAIDHHLARAPGRSGLPRESLEGAHGARILPGESGPEPVEEKLLRVLDHGPRQVRPAESGEELAERLGRIRGHQIAPVT